MNKAHACIPSSDAAVSPAGRFATAANLLKMPISLLITLSALTGFAMNPSGPGGFPFALLTGIFLLACGSAAVNNYQDRHLDAAWSRTCRRPLPAGRLQPGFAVKSGAMLITCGFLFLPALEHGVVLVTLGIAAVVCYNMMYTPLKRKTMWAAVPGAVCGMLPPLMGWMASGGALVDFRIWNLMAVMGIWQLPHFWLVVLHHPQDYRQNSLPSMAGLFSREQLHRILLSWTVAFAAISLLLIVHCVHSRSLGLLLAANATFLSALFCRNLLFFRESNVIYQPLFLAINLSLALVLATISVDALMR